MQECPQHQPRRLPLYQQLAPLKHNFTVSVALACATVVVLLLALTEYPTGLEAGTVERHYPFLNQIMGMVFLGIGLLMSFLRRYSFSAICLNFFGSCLVFAEAVLCVGAAQQLLAGPHLSKLVIDLPLLEEGVFSAAAAMIAFAAFVGTATPTQVVWVLMALPPIYALNQHLILEVLEALDMGGSIGVHVFGCYYGLAASAALSRGKVGCGGGNANLGSCYTSDIISMVGTAFLWINWPSFNGALASVSVAEVEAGGVSPELADAQFLSIANSILSLVGSALATFATSAYLDGKLSAVAVQNATLAGGVVVGSACTLRMAPAAPFIAGLCAGAVSTAGFKYLSPRLDEKWGLLDTCGVNNLHGMPGIMGALYAGMVAYAQDVPNDSIPHSSSTQILYQAAALACTIGMSLAGGYVAGSLARAVNPCSTPGLSADSMYEDDLWWTRDGNCNCQGFVSSSEEPTELCGTHGVTVAMAAETDTASATAAAVPC